MDRGTDKGRRQGKEKEKDGSADRRSGSIRNRHERKETTNLLPGQTVALYRFDVDKVRQTPSRASVRPGDDAGCSSRRSASSSSDVAVYYHAFVGETATRSASSASRTRRRRPKDPAATDVAGRVPKKIKNRKLYTVKSNPFVNGVVERLLDLVRSSPTATRSSRRARAKPPENQPIGVCVYDTQHVLVGDHTLLEKFLADSTTTGTRSSRACR